MSIHKRKVDPIDVAIAVMLAVFSTIIFAFLFIWS